MTWLWQEKGEGRRKATRRGKTFSFPLPEISSEKKRMENQFLPSQLLQQQRQAAAAAVNEVETYKTVK